MGIVGGEDAADGEFPWQVQLRSSDSSRSLFCGGSVVNEEYVLTAAHCCSGLPRGVHVVAGGIKRIEDDEGEEQFSDVSQIIKHEDYDHQNQENDICLLHLKTKLEWTDFVKPAVLPAQMELTPEGANCTVTGWGTLHSGVLFRFILLFLLLFRFFGFFSCGSRSCNVYKLCFIFILIFLLFRLLAIARLCHNFLNRDTFLRR